MQRKKPSELFEGENSPLRRAYEEAVKNEPIAIYSKTNNKEIIMQRENKWQDRLNKILWENTDIVDNPERPMKAQLQDDLLIFIQSEIDTAIADRDKEIIEEVEKYEWFELNSDWDFIKNEVINKDK